MTLRYLDVSERKNNLWIVQNLSQDFKNTGFVYSHREEMKKELWGLLKFGHLGTDFILQEPDAQE